MRQAKDYIEFTASGNRKLLILLDAIDTVETNENGDCLVNGNIINQSYDDVVSLLDSYAVVTIDRELTTGNKEENNE